MISLFLVALSVTGYTHNGSNDYSALTPHNSQGGSVLYYDVDNYGSDIEANGNFSIITPNGSISYEINRTFSSDTNYYYYDLQFKVVNDSVLTNLYLYNLEAIYGCDGAEYHTTLPNVYFMGQSEYYIDNESGDYSIQFLNTGSNPYLYVNYYIGILPQNFIDGSGYQNGYSDGYNAGYDTGWDEGYTRGEAIGYSDGFEDGASVDDTAIVIFNGILNIALVPINFFLAIFNWELFGINMSALVTSILSVCLVVIVVRLVTGKNADGK